MLDEKTLKLYGSVDVAGAGICPTVKIVQAECPGGFCVINKADYNPETMELYDERSRRVK